MNWIIEEPGESFKPYEELSYIPSRILHNRIKGLGELDISNLSSFFDPKLSLLHPPESLKDMELASGRIVEAIKAGEKIRIHGDYDVDGITSTYILYKTLNTLGADVSYMLPNREIDGYGISDRFVEKCIKDPCLIITVDCGVSEYEKIKKLKEVGIDVIVTDHHKQGKDGIPKEAFAVIDPKREDEDCPFTSYAGVGVSFLLCWDICRTYTDDKQWISSHLKELVPYVALGTVADVMPLFGDNRVFTKVGLGMMRKGKIESGVRSLIDVSGLSLSSLTAKDIGFMIAPRINSAGRMDDPNVSLDCFIQGKRMIAAKLENLNNARKEVSQSLFEDASNKIDNTEKIKNAPIIVVSGKGWHNGVIGIAAGKIAEKYGRPTIVISLDDNGIGRGSARSIADFNLYDAVSCGSEFLGRFGGHAQALGLSIKEENIDAFRDKLTDLFADYSLDEESEDGIPLMVDCEVKLSMISPDLMKEIDKLSPFGEGNPEPIFIMKNASLLEHKAIGKDKNHLSVKISQDGHSMRGVAFFAEHLIELLEGADSEVDVAFTPVWNTFNGRTNLEMRVKDIKFSE